MKEELGLELKDFEFFKTDIHYNSVLDGDIELNLFLSKMPKISKLNCKEGKIFISSFSESLNLDLSETDKKLIKEVHNFLKSNNRMI